MTQELYLLDLDRTLFDTHRFFQDILHTLGRTHALDINEFTATWEAYVDPEAGGYDPHRHHGDLLGLSATQLDEVIHRELGDRDYLYPDAATWLRSHQHQTTIDLVIITVGRPRYQELKLHHAPLLRNLRKIVVATNKGELIRRHLQTGAGEYGLDFLDQPYDRITLIDDAPSTFTALGATTRLTGVRIARPGEKYSPLPTPPFIRHITSFEEL